MTPGADFALAFSPERVSSGTVLRDLATYPKIVGGIDDASTTAAARLLRRDARRRDPPVRDAETAEFSKLAETTYRDVNIALANEFARVGDALGVDTLRRDRRGEHAAVLARPRARPRRRRPLHPRLPVLHRRARKADAMSRSTRTLIATARRINDGMAAYAVDRLAAALGDARRHDGRRSSASPTAPA